jgi:hypothetical protein
MHPCFPSQGYCRHRDRRLPVQGSRREDGMTLTPVMCEPGFLLKFPDIPSLFTQGGGDSERSGGADRILVWLHFPVVAWECSDVALNHRIVQGTPSGVVSGRHRS